MRKREICGAFTFCQIGTWWWVYEEPQITNLSNQIVTRFNQNPGPLRFSFLFWKMWLLSTAKLIMIDDGCVLQFLTRIRKRSLKKHRLTIKEAFHFLLPNSLLHCFLLNKIIGTDWFPSLMIGAFRICDKSFIIQLNITYLSHEIGVIIMRCGGSGKRHASVYPQVLGSVSKLPLKIEMRKTL